MLDRSITLGASVVCAIGAWMVVVLLLAAATLLDNLYVAIWGLAASAGAATINVRAYFVHYGESVRNAYELGRDSGIHRVH